MEVLIVITRYSLFMGNVIADVSTALIDGIQ